MEAEELIVLRCTVPDCSTEGKSMVSYYQVVEKREDVDHAILCALASQRDAKVEILECTVKHSHGCMAKVYW